MNIDNSDNCIVDDYPADKHSSFEELPFEGLYAEVARTELMPLFVGFLWDNAETEI